MKTVLYRTTAKCATQCTAKIFFARIANQQPHLPCSQPDQSAPTPTTNVGAKHFSPKSQPATPHTCSQTVQSAPKPPINVGAKYFSPETQPATPHALFATRPSSPTPPINVRAKYFSPETQPATPHTMFATRLVNPTTTNQCRGEIFFARNATSNTAYPVRNPTRQPQHHLPTCGRKIFRPYNILPICLIPVTTLLLCPTPPATVGARCAGVARPRPPQRLYLAKSI